MKAELNDTKKASDLWIFGPMESILHIFAAKILRSIDNGVHEQKFYADSDPEVTLKENSSG